MRDTRLTGTHVGSTDSTLALDNTGVVPLGPRRASKPTKVFSRRKDSAVVLIRRDVRFVLRYRVTWSNSIFRGVGRSFSLGQPTGSG